jgi:dTDP-4-dehydrorhamnose 3,5-epimerase
MRTLSTSLEGVTILEPDVHGDGRGYFLETWNAARHASLGLPERYAQDNFSSSRKGVLRGLHYQHPNGQGKLVWVVEGEVFDVAVDIRHGSPTFARWFGVHLSGENHRQFYIPPGFAHGFLVLSDRALFCYKCTRLYEPAHDHSVLWDDPELAIEWPLRDEPILSPKDASAPRLRDVSGEHLPQYGREP